MAQKNVKLEETPFPPYAMHIFGDRYLFVAGGGGQAKTGVPNAFVIYEMKHVNGSCILNKVIQHDTGSGAIMNSSIISDENRVVLATGMDDMCKLYTLHYKVVKTKQSEGQDGVRKRRGNLTQSEDHKNAPSIITFDVDPGKEVQTDPEYQRVVRLSKQVAKDQMMLVTGGTDGCVKLWKYPDMEKLSVVKDHTGEIDDIDISPQGNRVVSLGKDSCAYVWSTKDLKLKKHAELNWHSPKDVKYRYRSCRYGVVSDKTEEYKLYTSHIPCVRTERPKPCYLTKWDTTKYIPNKSVSTGTEILSALAISSDGVYLGVGTISGSVSVHIAFSLQRLYHIHEAHKIFVTGLDFAPNTQESRAITGNHDFTLFSMSADNKIRIHQEAPRTMYSVFWVLAGFLIIIYFLFWGISMIGI